MKKVVMAGVFLTAGVVFVSAQSTEKEARKAEKAKVETKVEATTEAKAEVDTAASKVEQKKAAETLEVSAQLAEVKTEPAAAEKKPAEKRDPMN